MLLKDIRTRLRLLVIVSADYGELGGAMYFLHGLGLSVPPTVLLPASLGHSLGDSPELRVRSYDSFADIQSHLMAGTVDAVMLFSGYLLTIGHRFSLVNDLRLLRLLRRHSMPVVTSDPFLALIHSPADLDFKSVLDPRGSTVGRHLTSWRLALRLYLLRLQLRDCWHVYPSPIQRIHGDRTGPRALSYFNAAPSGLGPCSRQGPPSWIFVLSEIDCQMQTRAGATGFVELLAARLRETVGFGNHAVLLAPAWFLAAVRPRLVDVEQGIELVSNADYAQFSRLLLGAQYAFFWNYYSFSIIHRVIDQLPVLFFDAGHMVRILPALADAGIRLFYDGWRPPVLRLATPFDRVDLAERATESSRQFLRITEGLRQCSSPLEVLGRVLASPDLQVLDAKALRP